MTVYRSEDEQLAAIKVWFKTHQRSLFVVFVLVASSMIVYQYWMRHVSKQNDAISFAYTRMMNAQAAGDNKAIRAYAQQLITDYPRTVYADVAELTLARYYVSDTQWDKARAALQTVMKAGHTPALKALAAKRLQRVIAFEKKYPQGV